MVRRITRDEAIRRYEKATGIPFHKAHQYSNYNLTEILRGSLKMNVEVR